MIAHKRRAELVVQDQNGNLRRAKPQTGLFARLFRRG
jgi:hypothetical protein